MEGRTFNFGDYLFGFNGKEADSNQEWGSATHYDCGFRIYNPTIGKFLSVDPLAPDYPFYSPYHFAGNKPILMVDLDGQEPQLNPLTQAALDMWDFFTSDEVSSLEILDPLTFDKTRSLIWTAAEKIYGEDVVNLSDDSEFTTDDIPEFLGEGLTILVMMNPAGRGTTTRKPSGQKPNGQSTTSTVSKEAISEGIETLDDFAKTGPEQPLGGTLNSSGAARAAQFSKNWHNASLRETVEKFAPNRPVL